MSPLTPDKIALQLRIGLLRTGVIPAMVAMSLLFGLATWGRLAVNGREWELRERTLAQPQQRLNVPLAPRVEGGGSLAGQNLRKFYDALGERSEAGESLKTVFEIAKQTGLSLDQGEYTWQFDKNSNTYGYQILLPVKGAYGEIRRFCEQVLLALPFASLDQWSFKRESVGDDAIEVTLHFTLYLKDGTQQAGTVK